jgi:signal peptidase I
MNSDDLNITNDEHSDIFSKDLNDHEEKTEASDFGSDKDGSDDPLLSGAEDTEIEATAFTETLFVPPDDTSDPYIGAEYPISEEQTADITDSDVEEGEFFEEYLEAARPPEKKGYNPDKPRGIDFMFDLVELLIFSLAAVLIATTFFFRHSIVDGGSMERTLFNGEHLIISDFLYTPERGDIIVCEDYSTSLKKPIIKRVIGLPGDKVEINMYGEVKINGEPLQEDYIFETFPDSIYNRVSLIVPEGELFVMGDHRDNSTDSRDPSVGTIDIDSVLGRVLFRFYPFEKFGKVE